MIKIKNLFKTFTKFELCLWFCSLTIVAVTSIMSNDANIISVIASLLGVSSIIFIAKGLPSGQLLVILFSVLYAIISWRFAYYGEMITYVFMTLPIAVISFITWLRHPFKKGESEVSVARTTPKKLVIVSILSVAVTVAFYFLLKYFNTANLVFSTLSITTSFLAASLSYFRSPYFPLAYALNDLVLIVLWCFAALNDVSYFTMVICFAVFFVNDIYAFISWIRMYKRQEKERKGKG